MNLVIKTRVASASDAERVAALISDFRHEKSYTAQTSVPLPVDQRGPLYVMLAEVEGPKLVGITSLHRGHHLVKGATFMMVTDLYVVEKYRRHGVAVLLLNECIALARREGCDCVRITIEDDDVAMLATAERAGFAPQSGRFLTLGLKGDQLSSK